MSWLEKAIDTQVQPKDAQTFDVRNPTAKNEAARN
jgi:hypothetical protein